MSDPAPERSVELLRHWQEEGDRAALEELLWIEIGVLKGRLRRQGARTVDRSVSVSDVAQEVVLRALEVEPAPHFDNPFALRGYLWTAARRLLAEHLRRGKAPALPLEMSHTGQLDKALHCTGGLQGVEARDHADALSIALQLLEPEDRQMLELHYFRSLDAAAIAAQLGVSADVARTRVARARTSLARKLVKWTEVIG
jgi:RNA polymerase sigma factor (sigma-70 family)